jgi:hypothetical protein
VLHISSPCGARLFRGHGGRYYHARDLALVLCILLGLLNRRLDKITTMKKWIILALIAAAAIAVYVASQRPDALRVSAAPVSRGDLIASVTNTRAGTVDVPARRTALATGAVSSGCTWLTALSVARVAAAGVVER